MLPIAILFYLVNNSYTLNNGDNEMTERKKINRGDKTAITRDGREVTQLTWFDGVKANRDACVGVINGDIFTWTTNGKYYGDFTSSDSDIFAAPEYEWQWVYWSCDDMAYKTSCFYKENSLPEYLKNPPKPTIRIEQSKREVKS